MANTIEITFKSPTDRISPYIASINENWNVSKLKNYLKDNYPSKPSIESQKIIYCGKLLKDDQLLKSIFENKTSVIVHFLCQPTVTVQEESKIKTEEKVNEEELYKEYQEYLANFYSSNMQNFAALTPYQQYMWMNQAYMQSYASYFNQFQNKTEPNKTVIQRTVTNESNSQNHENRVIENDRPINAEQNGMQNVVAAALNGIVGGGEDENDGVDAEPRDILHYFYMLVRLGLLVLICYYYSSFFSILATFMLFFLFFAVNFFRRNNAQGITRNPPRIIEIEQENQQNQTDSPSAQQGDATNNKKEVVESAATANVTNPTPETEVTNNVQLPTNNNTDNVIPPEIDLPPGIIDRLSQFTCATVKFVATFILTLFPDPIADIEQN